MDFIKTVDKKSGETIEISYKDYGQGRPVVLIHGWPLSKEMWEYQLEALVNAGFRCIKYDRRGFGKSSKPWTGYDYDSLTDDLHALLTQLDLQDVALVGFSMGGGEIARYFSRYGGERVTQAVLISSILPFRVKTANNPDGAEKATFEANIKAIKEDRMSFLDGFTKKFFGVNMIKKPVSNPLLSYYNMLASVASPQATSECAEAFAYTDFREDIPFIQVPTLIIHGDMDKNVPIESSSVLTHKLIAGSKFLIYEDAPHGLFITNKDQLNQDLIQFLKLKEDNASTAARQKSAVS